MEVIRSGFHPVEAARTPREARRSTDYLKNSIALLANAAENGPAYYLNYPPHFTVTESEVILSSYNQDYFIRSRSYSGIEGTRNAYTRLVDIEAGDIGYSVLGRKVTAFTLSEAVGSNFVSNRKLRLAGANFENVEDKDTMDFLRELRAASINGELTWELYDKKEQEIANLPKTTSRNLWLPRMDRYSPYSRKLKTFSPA